MHPSVSSSCSVMETRSRPRAGSPRPWLTAPTPAWSYGPNLTWNASRPPTTPGQAVDPDAPTPLTPLTRWADGSLASTAESTTRNGLAVGAAAGTLHPAADRPFARPRGGSHGARATASRALRGPSGRPAAALDPVPAPRAAIHAASGWRGHAARPRTGGRRDFAGISRSTALGSGMTGCGRTQ